MKETTVNVSDDLHRQRRALLRVLNQRGWPWSVEISLELDRLDSLLASNMEKSSHAGQ